jgi:hypothetical protein
MPGTRLSTSAIPEHVDPDFVLPDDCTIEFSTRHSVTFLPATQQHDTGNCHGVDAAFGGRESNFSDVSGADVLHFWNVENENESSNASTAGITPRTMMRNDPYHGVTVEVNNHSINNHGVVMYHVDIKGPDGLLSTYTIRRRYRAFRNLHIEMTRLLEEYTKQNDAKPPASFSFTSPASQSQVQQQQAFTHVVLPPLPSAGVWSYLKRHDVRLVEQRKKRFQEILRIAIRHPATRSSAVMDTFLSVAPSEISQRGSSYVSLQDYSVPVMDRQREHVERRQRKMKVLETRRQRTNSEAELP